MSAESTTSLTAARPKVGRLSLQRFWWKVGIYYLFLLPALLLYALFMLYPFFNSIYLSMTEWDGAFPVKEFVGVNNYVRLAQDRLVWLSLSHNLIWVIVGTVVPIAIGLFLAVLLWSKPWGMTLFRTVYFMPVVLASVIVGIIWHWIYNPVVGILNLGLEAIGLGSWTRGWLGDVHLALYAVLAAAIWAYIGFVFVILLAGLQNVDLELIDAAKIDGANAWRQFWHVTVPQLAHVLTLVTALSLIGGFSVFDIVFVMTGGGPANATELIATYTYQKAFAENEVGYAAALSLVMTAISLVATLIFIRIRERE
jgi:ABC-type sugar transport system permease subunit